MRRALFPYIFLSILFLIGCHSQTTIINSVAERDANEIIVLLSNKGVAAVKEPAPSSTVGGASTEKLWNITVPSAQITEALGILNQAGLPRLKGTTLLDLFGTSGLVPSDLQDRIRYQEGLSEQLATTIRKMDGIIDADIQITFPQEEEGARPLTASVYVKHRGILDNPNSLGVTKIKRLIASAVPGLTVDTVSVITDRALYADAASFESPAHLQEVGALVEIWGIHILRDSAPLFRVIFYSFLIVLFIIACALVWLIWKVMPIIQKMGVASLVKIEPYRASSETKEGAVKDEEEGAPPT